MFTSLARSVRETVACAPARSGAPRPTGRDAAAMRRLRADAAPRRALRALRPGGGCGARARLPAVPGDGDRARVDQGGNADPADDRRRPPPPSPRARRAPRAVALERRDDR